MIRNWTILGLLAMVLSAGLLSCCTSHDHDRDRNLSGDDSGRATIHQTDKGYR